MYPSANIDGSYDITAGKDHGTLIAGVILGALGIYKKIEAFGGCGATVPLSGFGFSLWKGMKEAVDNHGFLGLFEGGFTAAAVGTSAALIFSYLASLIFQPKIKK